MHSLLCCKMSLCLLRVLLWTPYWSLQYPQRKGVPAGVGEVPAGEEEEEERQKVEHVTGPQELRRAGLAGSSGDGPVQPLLTAGSPRADGMWKSKKKARSGSKTNNTGAGETGTHTHTHTVACSQKIAGDVLQP